jgi:hypothetical protein
VDKIGQIRRAFFEQCGFDSSGHKRAILTKLLGGSLLQYRERFRKPGRPSA